MVRDTHWRGQGQVDVHFASRSSFVFVEPEYMGQGAHPAAAREHGRIRAGQSTACYLSNTPRIPSSFSASLCKR